VRPYNDSAMNTASRVATGLAGIAAVVLLFVGQFVGAIGSRTEPEFDSSTQEIVAFLGSLRSGPQTAGSVIVLVGVVAFLAFAAGLRDVLAPADQGLPALAVRTAQLCAVALVVAVMVGGWELSVLRARELDPQIARFIYDQGSLTFAKSWVLLGGFAAGVGVAVLTGRAVPAWLGWWALADAAGFVVARAVWLTQFWLVPYLVLWLWIVIVSVVVLVRTRREQRRATGGEPALP
jgi:hypothetical protein